MAMVVVGASLAGAKAAQALRAQGFDGEIVLIGSEDEFPYERPALSKDFLQGKSDREKVFVHPADWYAEHRVELRSGRTAVGIDRARHTVLLADGDSVMYSKLLLATGASPRRLPMPGGDAPSLAYLRPIADSERLRASFVPGQRLLVIGAGWIGLEAAAAARTAGMEVTVVEAAEQPLLRVLGPEVGARFADLHRAHGVDLRLGAMITEFVLDRNDGAGGGDASTGDGAADVTSTGGSNSASSGDEALGGRATGIRLADGTVIGGDTILVAIRAAPNTSLAEDAGLEVDNGVLVDTGLRSSDPDILAAGDRAPAGHPVSRQATPGE